MKHLWIGLALLLPQDDHRKIVDVRLTGLQSQGCYVAVEKALTRVKGVERVVFWCQKGSYRAHIVVKDATPTLADLESAFAAAEKEMKDSLSMTVDYGLDEADFALPAGTKFVADEKEQTVEKATTLAEFRKTVTFSSLVLPQRPHPKCQFVCPRNCSAGEGVFPCPKCGSDLVRVSGNRGDS
jgi:copper chaperone CopZ